ncbi:hypothetical protein BJ742DRAFT_735216 [Cladochytrium replicatum]|nr:hypothetical protein BJ742DRAFT_735216 [Cladochytrium replicatum]
MQSIDSNSRILFCAAIVARAHLTVVAPNADASASASDSYAGESLTVLPISTNTLRCEGDDNALIVLKIFRRRSKLVPLYRFRQQLESTPKCCTPGRFPIDTRNCPGFTSAPISTDTVPLSRALVLPLSFPFSLKHLFNQVHIPSTLSQRPLHKIHKLRRLRCLDDVQINTFGNRLREEVSPTLTPRDFGVVEQDSQLGFFWNGTTNRCRNCSQQRRGMFPPPVNTTGRHRYFLQFFE